LDGRTDPNPCKSKFRSITANPSRSAGDDCFWKDTITMADQLLTPGWYLQPPTSPYSIPNGLPALWPPNEPLIQSSPRPASNGGILGRLAARARQASADLGRPPASGGILGTLTASPEDQTPNIPHWLQTAMPFELARGAPLALGGPRPQPMSLLRDLSELSNLSALPSAHFDSSSPYWPRTSLPFDATSDIFGVPRWPAEQPPNPAAQLWPPTAPDFSTPQMPSVLPPMFFAVPPNEGNPSLWQTPVDSNAEALASRAPDAVSARDLSAPGITPPTLDYGRQLEDMLTNNWRPDSSAASTSAAHHALSDSSPVVPSEHPAYRPWMNGTTDAESGSRVVSDITPDNDWRPGARYAQIPRPPRRGSGRDLQPEPGQASRLSEAQTRAEATIARVRQIDPSWRPRPSAYESIEGLIRAYESDAEQAQARLRELAAPLPPIIPRERPSATSERNDVAREVARWLAQNRGHVIENVDWFFEYEPSVQAYLDPPKTLQELHEAVPTSKPGYDIHHIVERMSAEQDGFPKSVINGPENLVRIPRFKHWEITSWYMTKNENYGGRSPRDYLRGKDWDERWRVGVEALIRQGVLKR
jgi:hypothetical protein